jgi:hypothetical protein
VVALSSDLSQFGYQSAATIPGSVAVNPGISKLPWPGTCNALFTRKFAEQPSADAVLKLIAVCDLYALYAQARTLIVAYRALIEPRLDVLKLHSAMSPSQLSTLVADLDLSPPRFLPHLGLGLWSTVTRVINKLV